MSQKEMIVIELRGTGISLTAEEALKMFGIQNLRARMSELRHAGLRVRTTTLHEGKPGRPAVAYYISARDVNGSRAKRYAY